MSKVIKSELTSSSLDNLNNLLSKEISDTENLINTINKFLILLNEQRNFAIEVYLVNLS
mgnify:CR=1 FL=1